MTRRKPRAPQGRKTRLLEPGMQERLVKQTQLGVPMNVAAASSGIALRTFVDWMQRGRNEEDRLAEATANGTTTTPDPDEAIYLDLYRQVMQARADAAVRNVGHIAKVAAGGFVTETTTRTYRDADGKKITETVEKRASPDWRAAAWYLERAHPGEFGKNATQVEVVGLPGAAAAGQVESVDFATDLAARVAANVTALTAPQIGAAPEVIVDAEVEHDEGAT